MKRFEHWIYDKETQEIEEGIVLDWLKNKFDILVSAVRNLKLGQSKRISFNFRKINEGFITEAGGWQSTVCGVYAEKWAIYSFIVEMDKSGFYVDASAAEAKKYAEDYGKLLKKSVATGISQVGSRQAKLSTSDIETTKKELDNYKEKGLAMGKRIFLEDIVPEGDSRFCRFEIVHTGGSESQNSTADVVVKKFTEKEIKEEYLYSLKSYLSDGKKTRGTQKDPFGVLGDAIGLSNVTSKTFPKYESQFNKAYGSEISVYAKKMFELRNFYSVTLKELKSKRAPKHVEKAKLLVAKKYGGEIIDLQNTYWQKCFEIAAEKKPKEFATAVLELLDMRDYSPSLITSGMDKRGQITTYRNMSPEIQKLMSTSPEDVEVKIITNMRKVTPALRPYLSVDKVANSNLMISFSVEGVELYRVGSQLWTSGIAQFSSTAGNLKHKSQLQASINEFLSGEESREMEKRIKQISRLKAKRRPISISGVNVEKVFKPSAADKRYLRQIISYASKEGLDITKLSSKQAAEVLDLVSKRKLTPEQALIEFEDKL